MKRVVMLFIAVSMVLIVTAPGIAMERSLITGRDILPGMMEKHGRFGFFDTGSLPDDFNSGFNLQAVFKINDKAGDFPHFKEFKKRWEDFSPDSHGGIFSKDGVDLGDAYINMKTPFGIFGIGKMDGQIFGTPFGDTNMPGHRVQYTLPLGNLSILALFEKRTENAQNAETVIINEDACGMALIYKVPIGISGFLFEYESKQPQKDHKQKEFFINPYFDIEMGTLNVLGEMKYQWGDITDSVSGMIDTGIDRFAANIEISMPVGPVSLMTGYAYMGGDADYQTGNRDKEQSWFIGGTGDDWQKLRLLTGDEEFLGAALGGIGNLVSGAGIYGCKLIYLGASLSPMENLDIDLVLGASEAEDVPVGWDYHHGIEGDFAISYKVYDRLSYRFIAAFLEAGDFWKYGIEDKEVEDTFSFFNNLRLDF